MRSLVMTFALLCFSVLQAIIPSWTAMGQAKVPLLLGLCIYYALNHSRNAMLLCAVLAGLLQDALSLSPLGYSSFCFCVVGVVALRFKEVIFVQQWMTYTLTGAMAAGAVTAMMALLLARHGVVGPHLAWVGLKILGESLLGAVTTPLIFRAVTTLDHLVGNVERKIV